MVSQEEKEEYEAKEISSSSEPSKGRSDAIVGKKIWHVSQTIVFFCSQSLDSMKTWHPETQMKMLPCSLVGAAQLLMTLSHQLLARARRHVVPTAITRCEITSVFETAVVDRVWLLSSLLDWASHQSHTGQNWPRSESHFHLGDVEDYKHIDLPLVSTHQIKCPLC